MLSKRLLEISKLIPKEANVIDIGCDHALLDIYLTLNNDNKCIASDISEKVIQNANKNIKKYNLTDKIETIVSDGIKNIQIKNNSVIVISGMGTHTIIDIVKNIDNRKVTKLIIQSNNDLYELRNNIIKLGYIINQEKVVYDNKKYYVIIDFIKGNKKYNKKELLYGVNSIIDVDYSKYILYLINKNNEIISRLNIKHLNKILKLLKENLTLKKKLK